MIEERTFILKASEDLIGIADYRSPIELIESRLHTETEGMVLKAIQKIGVNVDKDELIRALNYDRDQFVMGYKRGFEAGKSINEWIPCKERLPECYEWVLCTIGSGDKQMTTVLRREGNSRWFDIGDWSYDFDVVTAWMFLPEPFESEVDDDD